jgi:hypothetical protein
MKAVDYSGLLRRYRSLRERISALTSLREVANLPRLSDLTPRQWTALDSQLESLKMYLLSRLDAAAKRYLYSIGQHSAVEFNSLLGNFELELTKAFSFYDTCADMITQRCSKFGILLAGCDVIAYDAMIKNHPALQILEPPIVYCDRGFGASILRQGIRIFPNVVTPFAFIQIPWFKKKEDLSSILHEMGHLVFGTLGLLGPIARALRVNLGRAGASQDLVNLFVRCVPEISSDFYGFCCSGVAQALSIKEILSLPPSKVFFISDTDVHPPIYLRVLLSIMWCKIFWGRGIWDKMEREWLEFYPMHNVSKDVKTVLDEGRRYLDLVSRVLIDTKFESINGRRLVDLFDMNKLNPWKLEKIVQSAVSSRSLNLKGLTPCTQLTVIRMLREDPNVTDESFDQLMTTWLFKLAKSRGILTNDSYKTHHFQGSRSLCRCTIL